MQNAHELSRERLNSDNSLCVLCFGKQIEWLSLPQGRWLIEGFVERGGGGALNPLKKGAVAATSLPKAALLRSHPSDLALLGSWSLEGQSGGLLLAPEERNKSLGLKTRLEDEVRNIDLGGISCELLFHLYGVVKSSPS